MKIGNIDLGERPVLLAPMEDVTDVSFRSICREQGADMVYTEFVSADAVIRNIDSTLRKMVIRPGERPAAIQIYGKELEPMVEAARIAQEARPEVIDINFGCPVKKVARKGAGAGMLQNIPLLLEITRAVVRAVDVPVTVKTRLGWDHNSKIIVELAEQLQDCGIQALAIHGRTRSQLYTGEADTDETSVSLRQNLQTATHADGRPVFNPIVAYSFMLFVLLYFPCIAALAAIRREAGNGWMAFTVVYTTVVAWLASFLFFRIATWLTA